MSEKRDSFVFYRSFWEAIKELPEEYKSKVMDAICTYALDGEETEKDPVVNAMFRLIQPQIDANNKRYENGKKGGRPSKKKKQEPNVSAKKADNISAKQGGTKRESKDKEEKPNENQTETTSEPNVNDNVNVDVNVNANANDNVNDATEADQLFERVWKLYPNQRGKASVSDDMKREIAKIGEEEIVRAINRYANDLREDGWRKPQNGSTFFGGGYVDYLDANYQKPQRQYQGQTPMQSALYSKAHNFQERTYDFDDLEERYIQKVNSGM